VNIALIKIIYNSLRILNKIYKCWKKWIRIKYLKIICSKSKLKKVIKRQISKFKMSKFSKNSRIKIIIRELKIRFKSRVRMLVLVVRVSGINLLVRFSFKSKIRIKIRFRMLKIGSRIQNLRTRLQLFNFRKVKIKFSKLISILEI
jgi:hypothetical protein